MITFHTILGCLALLSGFLVFVLPKGTAFHRIIGYFYATSILSLCFLSFLIFELFGRFGVFHIFSIVSILTVLSGLIPAIRRGKGWFELHQNFMLWSYVGLVLATSSHFFRPVFVFFKTQGFAVLPTWIFTAFIIWAIPSIIGTIWIKFITRKPEEKSQKFSILSWL